MMTSKAQKTHDQKRTASTAAAPRTEGQRLLLEVNGSHAEVGERIGASKQAVSYWRRGEKTPGPKARAFMRDAYGIEPAAWERAVVPPEQPEADAAGSASPSAPSPRARSATTLDEVVAELEYLHELRQGQGLMPSERVRLSDSISKNLALKARLERDQELLDDRIVREHPAWRRIEDGLIAWAKAHGPDVARSLAETLAGLA